MEQERQNKFLMFICIGFMFVSLGGMFTVLEGDSQPNDPFYDVASVGSFILALIFFALAFVMKWRSNQRQDNQKDE